MITPLADPQHLTISRRDGQHIDSAYSPADRLAGVNPSHGYSHTTPRFTVSGRRSTQQGFALFGFREAPLREGDRLRLRQGDGDTQRESGWYDIQGNLVLRNLRFTEGPLVGASRQWADHVYYAEYPPLQVVEPLDRPNWYNWILLGDLAYGDDVRLRNQRHNMDGAIAPEDVPESFPVQAFLTRDGTIVSRAELTLSHVTDFAGSLVVYQNSDYPGFDLQDGDSITARIPLCQ